MWMHASTKWYTLKTKIPWSCLEIPFDTKLVMRCFENPSELIHISNTYLQLVERGIPIEWPILSITFQYSHKVSRWIKQSPKWIRSTPTSHLNFAGSKNTIDPLLFYHANPYLCLNLLSQKPNLVNFFSWLASIIYQIASDIISLAFSLQKSVLTDNWIWKNRLPKTKQKNSIPCVSEKITKSLLYKDNCLMPATS